MTIAVRLTAIILHSILTNKHGCGEDLYVAVNVQHPNVQHFSSSSFSGLHGDANNVTATETSMRERFLIDWAAPYEDLFISSVWTTGSLLVVHPSQSSYYWKEAAWLAQRGDIHSNQYGSVFIPWYVAYFPRWLSANSLGGEGVGVVTSNLPLTLLSVVRRALSPASLLLTAADGVTTALLSSLLLSGSRWRRTSFPLSNRAQLTCLFVANPLMIALPVVESLACLEMLGATVSLWSWWKYSTAGCPSSVYSMLARVLWAAVALSASVCSGVRYSSMPLVIAYLFLHDVYCLFTNSSSRRRQGGAMGALLLGVPFLLAVAGMVLGAFVSWCYGPAVSMSSEDRIQALSPLPRTGQVRFDTYNRIENFPPSLSFLWYARSMMYYMEYQRMFDFLVIFVPIWTSLSVTFLITTKALEAGVGSEPKDREALRSTHVARICVLLSAVLSLLIRSFVTIPNVLTLLLFMQCLTTPPQTTTETRREESQKAQAAAPPPQGRHVFHCLIVVVLVVLCAGDASVLHGWITRAYYISVFSFALGTLIIISLATITTSWWNTRMTQLKAILC